MPMVLGSTLSRRWAKLCLLVVGVSYLIAAPYSKVEESFHVQATHDLVYYGVDTAATAPYDHLEYPGVVPRTFVGALILAKVTAMTQWIVTGQSLDMVSPHFLEVYGRAILLLLSLSQTIGLADSLDPITGDCYLWVCLVQFHGMFYASRMLSNTFATIFTTRSVAHWIRKEYTEAAIDMVLAAALFRCDCILLLFCCGLVWLYGRHLTVVRAVITGGWTGITALLISVPLDSVLWQRWVWPEGEVLYYNTILNKSSDWGVLPWHWYWSTALPKAMLLTALFIPISVIRLPELLTNSNQTTLRNAVDTTWLQFLLPALGFVSLYSFLGHKEVRFLFPALPLFNVAAAAGLARLYNAAFPAKGKSSTLVAKLLFMGGILCLVASLGASVTFVAVSRWNYPGGHALQQLETYLQSHPAAEARVFIDVGAAMTGVSLFGQRQLQSKVPKVSFFKAGYEEEHQTKASLDAFTHLLTEKPSVEGFLVMSTSKGNPKLSLRKQRISTEDVIYIHENDQWQSDLLLR